MLVYKSKSTEHGPTTSYIYVTWNATLSLFGDESAYICNKHNRKARVPSGVVDDTTYSSHSHGLMAGLHDLTGLPNLYDSMIFRHNAASLWQYLLFPHHSQWNYLNVMHPLKPTILIFCRVFNSAWIKCIATALIQTTGSISQTHWYPLSSRCACMGWARKAWNATTT